MDISLSPSEESLRDALRRLLRREVTYELVDSAEVHGRLPDRLWEVLRHAGWLGVGAVELEDADVALVQWVLTLEEMGRVACPLPVVEHLAVVALLGVTEPQGERLLRASAGEMTVSVAHEDRPGGEVVVEEVGGTSRLTGEKMLVPYAADATHLLVVAGRPPGRGYYWLEAGGAGVERTPLGSVSRDQHCLVRFGAAPAELLAPESDDPRRDLVELYTLASDAYAVGLIGRMLEMSLDYVKTRVQFDHPLGHFQAVQHRCADMAAAHVGAQSLLYQAAWLLGKGRPSRQQLLMCHSYCRDAAALVLGHAHQVHGAMGFMMEYPLHQFSRRAKMYEQSLGQAWVHRDRYARAKAAELRERTSAPGWNPQKLVPH